MKAYRSLVHEFLPPLCAAIGLLKEYVVSPWVLRILVSSIRDSDRPPRNIVDLADPHHYYHSDLDTVFQWVCYDFMNNRVTPTHYSLQSRHDYRSDAAGAFLTSWVVEGSVSGAANSWFELDRRDNSQELFGLGYAATFEIAHPRECRFVRIRHLKDTAGMHCIILSRWEFFGQLRAITGGFPN
jgi:hypothetical protein